MTHKLLVEIPERIETSRLILRPYHAGDGSMYFSVGQKNRAHLRRFESMNAVLSPASVEEAEITIRELALEWSARNALFLGGFDKAAGEFVVQVYVGARCWETGDFELGYFVDCEHEGRGFVTEACRAVLDLLFRQLGARRVQLECSDANDGSIRVAEHLGFVREGRLRENHAHADGSFNSSLVFGMLRSDWEKAGIER